MTVMVAARKLIEDALREPMRGIGCRPRAAGWFTIGVAPHNLGVIAVATASAHTAPGTGSATLHIHVRNEDVERVVADVCEYKVEGYRTTTAGTSIGYLMPAQAWHDWFVSADTVGSVAAEMAAATHHYALPYLNALASDPQRLLTAVLQSPVYSQAIGVCRAVVVMAQMGDHGGALALLEEHLEAVEGRTDAAAVELTKVASPLRKWLGESVT